MSLAEIHAPATVGANARSLPRAVGLFLGAGVSLAMWFGLVKLAIALLGG